MGNQQVSQTKHFIYERYSCDDEGNVYKDCVNLIKGCVATTGYRQYRIGNKSLLGHRFVTECRLGRALKSSEIVNHLDFNKLNNSKDNLEITTARGNSHHFWNNVVIDTSNVEMSCKGNTLGEKNGMSKLSKEQAKSLILDILEYKTNDELALKYGLHTRYISLIRHKKRWKIAWIELGLETSKTIPSGSTPK